MALTLAEQFEHFEVRIERSKTNWEDALSKNNYRLALLSLRLLFERQLMLGLMHWRQGINPGDILRSAVTTLLTGAAHLLEMEPSTNNYAALPFHQSIYLAYLLEIPHPQLELHLVDDSVAGEAFLGNVLMGFADIGSFPDYSNRLPRGKRYAYPKKR